MEMGLAEIIAHFILIKSLETLKSCCILPPSRTSPNTQPVQTVLSVRDLGLLLNTGFSTRATKKARGMLFYLKRSFAALTPSIFLPLYKAFIRPHLKYAIQASSPILSRDCQALERVQILAVKFVKGLRHVP